MVFTTNVTFQRTFSFILLSNLQNLGYTKVVNVLISNFASFEQGALGVSIDVRVDSNSTAQYLLPLQQSLFTSTVFPEAVLVALRQYNLALFGPASVLILRVYSLRETLAPASAAASSSSGDGAGTQLAIGLPIALIALVAILILVLVLVRRRSRKNNSEAASKHRNAVDYEQSLPSLELGTLSAHRRRTKTFSADSSTAPQDNFVQARLAANANKNRYTDVMPYDSTRVKLFPVPGVPGSDYINANFIQGYDEDSWMIATQGPLQNTCSDFWRMIWEQRVAVIAMLAKLKEGGREKVYQYWPDEVGIARQYDSIEVKLIAAADERDFVLRTFILTHKPTGKTRELRHLQYLVWPDHGVPIDPSSFLAFALEVRRAHTGNTPLVSHCSAGVGRAGTFLAALLQMRQYDQEGTIDVPEVVSRMRRERPLIVQTASQYVFLHQVLVEYIVSRVSSCF